MAHSRRGRTTKAVIVVSGLPRSGTSMAMKMLEAGGLDILTDGIRAADEDNPAGYFELERVKELASSGDPSWIRHARGQGVKVISYLLQYLPTDLEYRVVFMNRNLDEILVSQSRMLERRGETADTSAAEMRQRFVDHLAKVRIVLRLRPCFEVLEVEYRQAIQDPLKTALVLRDFVGLPLDAEGMSKVVNPALYRNRRTGQEPR